MLNQFYAHKFFCGYGQVYLTKQNYSIRLKKGIFKNNAVIKLAGHTLSCIYILKIQIYISDFTYFKEENCPCIQ